jgi:hypothetical protein
LLPSAVRASWQLQKWDLLDDVLCRCERVQSDFDSCEEQRARDQPPSALSAFLLDIHSSQNKRNSSPLRIHNDDSFEVAIGYLLSCVHRGDSKGLEMAVKDFRVEVCFARLHTTQYIE